MKNIFKTIIIISLGISMMSCNSFAGILFPRIKFSFSPVGEQPPTTASERLNAGAKYPQTFKFYFSRAGNSFQYYFVPTIFVNKPYRVLHIKEMKYEWENNTGIFFENRSFELPVRYYITQNDWYWLGGIADFFNINFEKIFKGKKQGDKFLFRLIIIYSLDDEPENTQVLEYNVTAIKGEYINYLIYL